MAGEGMDESYSLISVDVKLAVAASLPRQMAA
jgi:hypothetical protein